MARMEVSDGIMTITMDRPKQRNAFNIAMYAHVQIARASMARARSLQVYRPHCRAHRCSCGRWRAGCVAAACLLACRLYLPVCARAAHGASFAAVILTGAGPLFSSGADVSGETAPPDRAAVAPVGIFMQCMLAFPKPIIAAVNGPAIGIGTTLLPHCDVRARVSRSQVLAGGALASRRSCIARRLRRSGRRSRASASCPSTSCEP